MTLYEDGKGVIKDVVIAHMWFNISASNGDEDAKTRRNLVESNMVDEQLVEAQKLARECIKKNYKNCGY